MRIKITPPVKRILEVELLNGKEIKLEVIRLKMNEVEAHDNKITELGIRYKANEITTDEYTFSILELGCVNFNRKDFADSDVDEVEQITTALTKLKSTKSPEEKKTQ